MVVFLVPDSLKKNQKGSDNCAIFGIHQSDVIEAAVKAFALFRVLSVSPLV